MKKSAPRDRHCAANAGVRDYFVWRTLEAGFDAFTLEDAEYVAVKPDARGLIRSRIFPGLVLDVKALLQLDAVKVLAILQRIAFRGHRSRDTTRLTARNRGLIVET